jgi:hypothetical protein
MGIRRGSISTPIIADGLVFNMDPANRTCYPKTGTTATDTIGNTSSTLNGTTFISTTGSGIFDFDGVDDYINTGTIDLGTKNSISYWFNQGLDGNTQAIIGSPDGGNYYITYSTYNYIHFSPNGSSPVFYSPYRNPRPPFNFPGVWGNYLITRNDNTFNVFVNGEKINISGTGTITGNTRVNMIGARIVSDNPINYANGSIGPIHMYNRALSANEVLHNYNALKSRFE